jgi:hypothetical protein
LHGVALPLAFPLMAAFGRKRFHSIAVRVIRLTDSRPSIVSRKPVRNILWNVISLPVRIWMIFWNWLMESRPGGYPRYRK